MHVCEEPYISLLRTIAAQCESYNTHTKILKNTKLHAYKKHSKQTAWCTFLNTMDRYICRVCDGLRLQVHSLQAAALTGECQTRRVLCGVYCSAAVTHSAKQSYH